MIFRTSQTILEPDPTNGWRSESADSPTKNIDQCLERKVSADVFLSTAKTVNCNTTRGQNKKFCQLVQDWTGQDRTDHAERAAYLRVDQRHVDVVVPDQ